MLGLFLKIININRLMFVTKLLELPLSWIYYPLYTKLNNSKNTHSKFDFNMSNF